MFHLSQFVDGRSAEIGVLGQYLDSELHLVDNTLPRRLVFNPQFKVIEIVIKAVAVFVMNVFVFSKWAAENLFHKYAVLQNFFAAAQVKPSVSGRMNVAFFGNRAPSAALPSALFAAKFLLHVVARMSAILGSTKVSLARFAAQLAFESRSGFLVHKEHLPDSFAAVKGEV